MMSLTLLFFLALAAFVAFVCLLGIFYRGGPEQLLDWSGDKVAQKRAAAEARDLESLIEVTNRSRREKGLPPLTSEDLQRELD